MKKNRSYDPRVQNSMPTDEDLHDFAVIVNDFPRQPIDLIGPYRR